MKVRRLSPDKRAELDILRQLLAPKVYQDFKLRCKEWGIFKRLRKRYEPIDFWQRIRPAIPLDSLTYFYGFGAEALHAEWRQYVAHIAIEQMEQDRDFERKIAQLERQVAAEEAVSPEAKQLDIVPKEEIIKRKPRNALEWADS